MRFWARIFEVAGVLLEKAGFVCLIFSTVLVFVAVVLRYGFRISIDWVEELSKLGILAMVFLTAGMLSLRGEHMRFSFISDRYKGKTADYCSLFSLLISLATAVLLTIGSYHLVYDEFCTGVLSESESFELWWFHGFMFVGLGIMSLCYVYLLFVSFLQKLGKSNEDL